VWTGAAPADDPRGAVSRRALLAASAALPLLLTACKGVQALGTPPPPAPDIVALRTAISAEETLLARYAAVQVRLRTQFPARATPQEVVMGAAVSAVRFEHVAHLAQLKSRLVQPAGSAPSPKPSPIVHVTGSVAAELMGLEQAEQAASDRLLGQLGGLPSSLAQLFASIAASEATHVPFLQAAGQGQ
jgi:hypothetical protein